MSARNKAVIFRLTEDEYTLLQDACRHAGGRNLSDYARTGLLNPHHDRLAAIEERLTTLQKDLRALRESLLPDSGE